MRVRSMAVAGVAALTMLVTGCSGAARSPPSELLAAVPAADGVAAPGAASPWSGGVGGRCPRPRGVEAPDARVTRLRRACRLGCPKHDEGI